jgi:ABC-type multidrug transport system permease subunit
MKRLGLFLQSELKLLLVHRVVLMVALIQPALMYALMSMVFVEPTFDMNIQAAQTPQEEQYLQAMQRVGIESGVPYINPVITNDANWIRQYVTMDTQENTLSVNQTFGNIDSNMIKNFRNRVTAAALIYWQDNLGDQAILIDQQPLLPRDVPYITYFGMALIPMGIFLGTAITSAIGTAFDFENGTILEMHMSPRPDWQYLLVQFMRMIVIGSLSAAINICAVGWISGVWPTGIYGIITPVWLLSLAGGSLGMLAGFITKKALPAFLISLVVSLLNWLFGNSFGLASGFAGWYETFSTFAPNRYLVEILFPHYYHVQAGTISQSWLMLGSFTVFMAVAISLFRSNTFKGEIR